MKSIKIGISAIVAVLTWSCSSSGHEQRYDEDVSYMIHEESAPASIWDDALLSSNQSAPARESASASRSAVEFAESESVSANERHSPASYISSSAATVNQNDTLRKMIRTANIRFKVKDVIKATYSIEDIVVKHNGFVENSDLASRINSTKETLIKEDSALVTVYYTVINTLVLRVPNTQLDAALKEIAQFVEFMDHRVINAKDVTLDLLSKTLEQNRLARYDERMRRAIDNTGRRLPDVGSAEENLLRRQAQADDAIIANLRTLDRINFSTINLYLYQNQNVRYEVIAKEKKIEPYSVPFGARFVDALKFGWTIIVEVILFITNIWSIFLVSLLIFLGIKYRKKWINFLKKLFK